MKRQKFINLRSKKKIQVNERPEIMIDLDKYILSDRIIEDSLRPITLKFKNKKYKLYHLEDEVQNGPTWKDGSKTMVVSLYAMRTQLV